MAVTTVTIKQGLLVLLVSLVVGCTATYTNHGYAPSDNDLTAVKVGRSTRDSVEQAIGRPASTGMLKNSGWYYAATKIKHFSYSPDTVVDRQLVAITFNKRGVVENVERFTLADGHVVALNRRVTDTGIKGKTFLRQLLKNIGRPDFSKTQ